MKNVITINGQRFEVEGNSNISVVGNTIRIGNDTVASGLSGIVEVKWEGPLANLTSDGSVSVAGDVAGNVDAGGSVKCGNVGKNVDAGGSIQCGTVAGNIDAGGSVMVSK